MGKAIKKVLVAIVIILVVIVAVVWFSLDWIAKAAVEQGGTYALGVETTVEDLSLSILGGRLTMDGLTVGNPEGYRTPYLMKSGHFEVEVDTGSLFSDPIVVNKFELDGLEVNIEQKVGTSNVSEVLANVERLASGEEETEEQVEEQGSKVKVDRIVIKNITANVQLLPIAGSATVLTVKVARLELNDVSTGEEGATVSELIRQLVPAILAAIIEEGRGTIPGDLLGGLEESVARSAKAVGEKGTELVEQAEDAAAKLAKDLGAKAQEGAKEVEKSVGGALKKLFGKKDEAPEEKKEE